MGGMAQASEGKTSMIRESKGDWPKITRKRFLQGMAAGTVALGAGRAFAQDAPDKRPNVLWLSTEDIGPHLGCYGDRHAITPNLDAFARESILYRNAHTAAPVCAPNRCCIITGVYPTSLGTMHMRSGGEGARESSVPPLPDAITTLPEVFRAAGYYCTNNSKEDYNFSTDRQMWDESSGQAHWRNRPTADTPFFAVFNYGLTHEGRVRRGGSDYEEQVEDLSPEERQDPSAIVPPPYHPDTPVVREQWAHYYELITTLDHWLAKRLEELREEGVERDTIVMFWSDHGAGLPRCKRWLYDSGTHVPVMLHIPAGWRGPLNSGEPAETDRIISSLDFGPTMLSLCGLAIPETMQGTAFAGPQAGTARKYVYGFRDRMDERYDMIRSVRDARYRYIRNYKPWKPYGQYLNYGERSPVMHEVHRLAEAGELKGPAAWPIWEAKPVEELYDCEHDPHEVNNLAGDEAHWEKLEELRAAHRDWRSRWPDLGFIPEPELARQGERHGTRYAYGRHLVERAGGETLGHLYEQPDAGVGQGKAKRSSADEAALDERAKESLATAFDYWNVLANSGMYRGEPDVDALREAMGHEAGEVRVLAAQALLMNDPETEGALDLLAGEAESDNEWVRLYAVTALDELGETARPAAPALKEALRDRENKYVVRVAYRALNELEGTENNVR